MHMPYVELDPEIILAAIDGQENVFTAEQEKAEAFYRQFICPSCKGGSLRKYFTPGHAFRQGSGWIIARATLICNECSCHFDPHSGLILEMGNPAKVPSALPIVNPSSSSSAH
jgi:hypothetical protein